MPVVSADFLTLESDQDAGPATPSGEYVTSLPDSFYEQFRDIRPPWRNALGYAVYKRTYARKVGESRTEEWWETCRRVHASALKQGRYTRDEAERLYGHMFYMRLNYAGRGLWQHGASTVETLGGASLNNCWGVLADHYKSFVFMFDQLMLGGGVGMNLQQKYVDKLPKIQAGVTISRKDGVDGAVNHFIVPDMREGWTKLLAKTLKAFFYSGEGFTWSAHCLRSEGAAIKGFGGIASGPENLERGIIDICAILESRVGQFLRDVDVGDIACIIGRTVKSGNVRRSAIILVGDVHSSAWLRFKRWSLGTLPGWRENANVSVACSDPNQLPDEYWESFSLDEHTGKARGENYGLVNFELAQKYGRIGHEKPDSGANVPNPCVTGDTLVATDGGWSRIDSLVGEYPLVRGSDGQLHKTTRVFETGRKPVYKLTTKAGFELKLTEDHRVLTPGGDVPVSELSVGGEVVLGMGDFGSRSEDARLLELVGYTVGNGFVSHAGKQPLLGITSGENASLLMDRLESTINSWKETKEPAGGQGARKVSVRVVPTGLKLSSCLPSLIDFLGQFAVLDKRSENKQLTGRAFELNPGGVSALLRGLFTADGTVANDGDKNNHIALDSSSLLLLQQTQLLLLGFGIKAKLYKNRRDAGVREMPDGKGGSKEYAHEAQHSLRITRSSRFRFEDEIGFLPESPKAAALTKMNGSVATYRDRMVDTIESLEYLGEETVYDLTEPETSHFVANGIVVHNCGEIFLWAMPGTGQGEPCNLGVLVLPNIESKEQFVECSRLGLRMLKGVAALDYHWKVTQEIVHKNMRLGLSLTGVCEFIPKRGQETLGEWCEAGYAAMEDEDTWYSKMMGWPLSIKYTTLKPDGSLGKVFGTTNGGHAGYSEWQKVRVQFGVQNPLVKELRDKGHVVEYKEDLSGEVDRNTVVIEFPIHNAGVICADDPEETALTQLERTAWLAKVWADNAVSVTIYYRQGELPVIQKWLKENPNRLKSVSFLRHSGHGFNQAPQEPITKGQYEEELRRIKGVYYVSGDTAEINVDTTQECAGGTCPTR